MIYVWQGFGFMVILLPLLFSWLLETFAPGLAQTYNYSITGLLSGVILFLWGKKWHNPDNNKIMLHDDEGNEYSSENHTDTLFWIPMEYCGIILMVAGIAVLFYKF